MKSIRVLTLIAFVSTLGFVGGCENTSPTIQQVYLTKGNNTYIQLDLKGRVANNTEEILAAISFFEQQHPELEVISWQAVERHNLFDFVDGLWVNHRPRK